MKIEWRDCMKELPEDGQDCLVDMKHGVHEGTWHQADGYFETYLFSDICFSGHRWIPIEELQDANT
jgi:hypothetical protein